MAKHSTLFNVIMGIAAVTLTVGAVVGIAKNLGYNTNNFKDKVSEVLEPSAQRKAERDLDFTFNTKYHVGDVATLPLLGSEYKSVLSWTTDESGTGKITISGGKLTAVAEGTKIKVVVTSTYTETEPQNAPADWVADTGEATKTFYITVVA